MLFVTSFLRQSQVVHDGDDDELHIPPRVQLSFQHIDAHGAYIMDACEYIYIYIGRAISDQFVQNLFNVETFAALPMDSVSREQTPLIGPSSIHV
jgi:hypothetical protein